MRNDEELEYLMMISFVFRENLNEKYQLYYENMFLRKHSQTLLTVSHTKSYYKII